MRFYTVSAGSSIRTECNSSKMKPTPICLSNSITTMSAQKLRKTKYRSDSSVLKGVRNYTPFTRIAGREMAIHVS